jgi:hypothetical protein
MLELVGQPLDRLRHAAAADANVEDVQVFGDRLHLRVKPGTADGVMAELPARLQSEGLQVSRIRPIAATLEDVFIELVEEADHAQGGNERGSQG